MSAIESNPLVPVAMQIILHAGDARKKAEEAVRHARSGDFDRARAALKEADGLILAAHHDQTGVIQEEARGTAYELILLFVHAQDTLMTARSELNISRELVDILETLDGRLRESGRPAKEERPNDHE